MSELFIDLINLLLLRYILTFNAAQSYSHKMIPDT